jgi:hypothetical protein
MVKVINGITADGRGWTRWCDKNGMWYATNAYWSSNDPEGDIARFLAEANSAQPTGDSQCQPEKTTEH